ncbi:MAG TPA: HAMP domain-containing sensor histidine kinase [Candidatus Limnocylindrales bacterium]|jgi:two-component system OmpR family sensor kinase
MFRRARFRLTLLNIVLFGVVLVVFSLVFYAAFATVLAPTFDPDPELTNEQVAVAAYQATLERIGLALVVGDATVIALVGLIAWVLAGRTLGPIREAHARQRRFVADASHEMRTPLAAMRASSENALAGESSPDELRRALEVAVVSSDRLARLTNDLLLLAKTDELPGTRREPIDLSVVVAETIEAYAVAHPDAPAPQVTLGVDLGVVADPDDIGRIVANLVDNAVRHGQPSTRAPVRVSTTATEREAIVEVADRGPGIAASDLERIFEPFHRVHSDATAPDGTGLGLAISRGLASRNGARLTVISDPGAGATFRLAVPRFS